MMTKAQSVPGLLVNSQAVIYAGLIAGTFFLLLNLFILILRTELNGSRKQLLPSFRMEYRRDVLNAKFKR